MSVEQTLDERGQRYGKFKDQAYISQCFKDVLHRSTLMAGKDLDPDMQEALEMILHKIARILNGDQNYTDTWHDIAGYAKLVEDRLKGIER